MQSRAELTDAEPYAITQYDVHAFQITHDPIRCLDAASVHLTEIIRSILGDDAIWPHSLSILCTFWLKECGEIHFQQNIIKPIQKSLLSYFTHINISKDTVLIHNITYIISLFVGECGFHPECELTDRSNNLKNKIHFCYNARMVHSKINRTSWDAGHSLIRGDENILISTNQNGLWRASIYIKSMNEYCNHWIGLTYDKYIYQKTVKRYFRDTSVPANMNSCIAYIAYPPYAVAREKEAFLRDKLTHQYDTMQNVNNKGKIKKKRNKKKFGVFNALEKSLGIKKFQMKENTRFNYVEYLASDFREQYSSKIHGRILKFNSQKQRWYGKIEADKNGDMECNKVVSEFRKNVSKDYAVWNTHRYIETFEPGDVIGIEVNVVENWCRFYKNGVMQYHVDELPMNVKQNNDDVDKGLWLFMNIEKDCCYVIDRKV